MSSLILNPHRFAAAPPADIEFVGGDYDTKTSFNLYMSVSGMGIQAGDIAICFCFADGTTPNAPSGFTSLDTNTDEDMRARFSVKTLTGSEGTISVSVGSGGIRIGFLTVWRNAVQPSSYSLSESNYAPSVATEEGSVLVDSCGVLYDGNIGGNPPTGFLDAIDRVQNKPCQGKVCYKTDPATPTSGTTNYSLSEDRGRAIYRVALARAA